MNINKIIAVCAAALVAAGSFAEDAKKLYPSDHFPVSSTLVFADAEIEKADRFVAFNDACGGLCRCRLHDGG